MEPGCRPVVLNWDKHKTQDSIPAAAAMETQLQPSGQEEVLQCPAAAGGTDSQVIQTDLSVSLTR